MKQLKFLTGMLCLLVGLSLSSCLDNSSSTIRNGSVIAKVNSTMYGGTFFSQINGVPIYPTAESVASWESRNDVELSSFNGQIAMVYFQWDSSVTDVNVDDKEITDVDFINMILLDAPAEIVEQKGVSVNDSVANGAIIGLEHDYGGSVGKDEPYFFDATSIVLPVEYYVGNSNNATVREHTVRLLYYPEEQEQGGILKLHLRHNTNGDEIDGSATSFEYAQNGLLGFYYKAFDLRDILTRYRQESGGTGGSVKRIQIEYEQNSYTWTLDDERTSVENYLLEPQSIQD